MIIRELRIAVILLLILFVVATLSGTAEEQKQANGGSASTTATATKNTKSADLPSLPPAALDHDYRLGVNDAIDVYVWREPELSRVVPVRPDGKISLPLVGELQAEGHTALELRAAIVERLKSYVSEPEVTVIVSQINSQRYFVMGEVASPGTYPLTVPTTVLQALSAAGGFREFADKDNITILRRTEGGATERIKFRYKDWLKKKQHVDHFVLKNGDVIVVP
jgi:polysaccharide export outer membrane protein